MSQRLVRMAELDIEPVHFGRYRSLLGEEVEAALRSEPDVLMLTRWRCASLRPVSARKEWSSLRLTDMEPAATFVRRQGPDAGVAAT